MPGPLFSLEDFVKALDEAQSRHGVPVPRERAPVPTADMAAPKFDAQPGLLTYHEVPSGPLRIHDDERFYGASMPARGEDMPAVGYYGESGRSLASKLAERKDSIAHTGRITGSDWVPQPGWERGMSKVSSTGAEIDTSKDAKFQSWLQDLNQKRAASEQKEADVPMRASEEGYDLYSLYKSGWKPGKDFGGNLPGQFSRAAWSGEPAHVVGMEAYERAKREFEASPEGQRRRREWAENARRARAEQATADKAYAEKAKKK